MDSQILSSARVIYAECLCGVVALSKFAVNFCKISISEGCSIGTMNQDRSVF